MQVTGKTRVYKNQYGYSVSDNQKNKDGSWTNFYIPVQFQKDLKLPEDKEDILINGFTKPYKYRDGKIGISYFITEWEPQKTNEPAVELDVEATFGTGAVVEPDDLDLPF